MNLIVCSNILERSLCAFGFVGFTNPNDVFVFFGAGNIHHFPVSVKRKFCDNLELQVNMYVKSFASSICILFINSKHLCFEYNNIGAKHDVCVIRLNCV